MILEFCLNNYLSIKDEMKISFLATSLKENLPEQNDSVPLTDTGVSLLRSAVVYGANASGKSNVLKALAFFKCTEPDYFKAFRMTAATIKVVGQAMNTTSLVSKAISIRDMEATKKRYYDQCWVVFDKDDFPANDFNNAITMAQKNGFHVAYSNQAFEYWFLLHFNLYTGALHRDNYASMLTKL